MLFNSSMHFLLSVQWRSCCLSPLLVWFIGIGGSGALKAWTLTTPCTGRVPARQRRTRSTLGGARGSPHTTTPSQCLWLAQPRVHRSLLCLWVALLRILSHTGTRSRPPSPVQSEARLWVSIRQKCATRHCRVSKMCAPTRSHKAGVCVWNDPMSKESRNVTIPLEEF